MATFAMTDCYIAIAGSDRSAHIKKVAIGVDAAELDVTDFASGGWTDVQGGLKSGQIQLTFQQDMAASSIDSIMWPLLGTVATFEIRATNAAVGTSNPKYTGSFFIKTWKPLDGDVGALATVDVTFPTSGAVTRATA
ncbi:MAG: hypothetical protein ACKVWR_00170 [Acidimicrobiales bacterium]